MRESSRSRRSAIPATHLQESRGTLGAHCRQLCPTTTTATPRCGASRTWRTAALDEEERTADARLAWQSGGASTDSRVGTFAVRRRSAARGPRRRHPAETDGEALGRLRSDHRPRPAALGCVAPHDQTAPAWRSRRRSGRTSPALAQRRRRPACAPSQRTHAPTQTASASDGPPAARARHRPPPPGTLHGDDRAAH
jgi:hypothetical protein